MKELRSFFYLRQSHGLIIIGLIVSFWIFARPCSSKTLALEDEENQLVVCISSPIISLDPTNYRDRNTQTVLKNIFDSLTTRDRNMNVVPQLAESWEALDDTTWEFKLRRGVKFHNGDDFTAEDVRSTLKRVAQDGALDGKTSPRKGLLGPLAGVRMVDDYTVQIQTEKPWAILPLMLTLQEIVPKKYLKTVGSKGFQMKPVGTGPFRFVRAEGEKLLILERFENYYGGSPRNPPVQVAPFKYLIFKTVSEGIERIARLKKGECDIITHLPTEAVAILEMAQAIKVVSHPATRSYFAEMNHAKSPLNNRRIRLAMNYAVDMHAVVDHILQGRGRVLPTVLLPNAFAYHASQKPYPYNPKLAKELLADAGFPEGFSIAINCTADNRQFANIIALFLTKIGVKSVIDVIDRDRPGTVGQNSQWDILVTSWGNSTLDPVGILVPKFRTGGRGNYSNYSNQEVDRLLSQAEGTLDRRMRENYYKKVQEIIYHDVPMIFGYAAEEHYGLREKVKNFLPSPGGMMNMHDVYLEDGD